jgi:hypothetical protein
MINELITQSNKLEERAECSKKILCIKDPLKGSVQYSVPVILLTLGQKS